MFLNKDNRYEFSVPNLIVHNSYKYQYITVTRIKYLFFMPKSFIYLFVLLFKIFSACILSLESLIFYNFLLNYFFECIIQFYRFICVIIFYYITGNFFIVIIEVSTVLFYEFVIS